MYDRLEFKIPPHLSYHNLNHTRYVVEKAIFLAEVEEVEEPQCSLIPVAALYHDIGYLKSGKDHEYSSCNYVRRELPFHGFAEQELEYICGMIMATRIPQHPESIAEKILADADLFYLGTDAYKTFSENLFEEIKHHDPNMDENEWRKVQCDFFESHTYHTPYGQAILDPVKQRNYRNL